VLPEYHLTSWVPDDPQFVPLCGQYKKYLDNYCALAKELKLNIVPGTIVEKHSDQLLNVAYFISTTGQILSSYTKKNLWHPERPHLTSSLHKPHVAFDTPIGKCGMLICWDLAFPEAFRELIAAGAKTIIIPTYWKLSDVNAAGLKANPLSEKLFLETTVVSRCFENTCCVVFVNAGMQEEDADRENFVGLRLVFPPFLCFVFMLCCAVLQICGNMHADFRGCSQVAVPFKGSLGQLGAEEGMSVVEVDMQILEDAEENYKVREDMGREGWHYEYSLTRDVNST
jgi:predicted amidohydrolase